MVIIRKRKLTNTTLYSVSYINGIPTFAMHENCKISTEKGWDFRYNVKIIDDKQIVLSSYKCDTLSCLNEIKEIYLFYDKEEALECYKELVAKEEQEMKKQIKALSNKLKLLKSLASSF